MRRLNLKEEKQICENKDIHGPREQREMINASVEEINKTDHDM